MDTLLNYSSAKQLHSNQDVTHTYHIYVEYSGYVVLRKHFINYVSNYVVNLSFGTDIIFAVQTVINNQNY